MCAFWEAQGGLPPRLRTLAEDVELARALRDGVEVTATIQLRPVADRDRALREHLASTQIIDPSTGEATA